VRSKGAQTPLGGVKGPPRPNKGGAADPQNKRRTSAALEATRTMKRPVRSPSPQGGVLTAAAQRERQGRRGASQPDHLVKLLQTIRVR